MSRKDEVVELEVEITRETEKAYLINHGGKKDVWMPKTQVRDVRGLGYGITRVMTITVWIANEKGLI